ncbi:MAG: AAA family ATPase [Lachnospiraceae bacterium]|nr:AAA family ATPase [Lachnospiraceae bacterium]
MSGMYECIYDLAKSLFKSLPDDYPEGLLYGFIKLNEMGPDKRSDFYKRNNISDTDQVEKDIREAYKIMTDHNIDPELLKNGLQLVIMKRKAVLDEGCENALIQSEFGQSNLTVPMIVEYALGAIPKEEAEAFSVGKKIPDVVAFTKMIEPGSNLIYKQGTIKEDDDINTAEPGQNDRPGVKTEFYCDVLNDYLESLKNAVPRFKEAGNKDLLWSRSLLVSIDDGYGFRTFVREIAKVYFADKNVDEEELDRFATVFKVDERDDSREERYADWDTLVGLYEKLHSVRREVIILGIDLTKWMSELNTPKIKEYLIKLSKPHKDLQYVFKIPYMEPGIVSDTAKVLNDVMSVKTLVVPPADNSQLIDYMFRKVKEYGYSFSEDCSDILEQAIVAEKNDGYFYGFNTLSKMVESVIYEKISNTSIDLDSKEIKAEELKGYIDLGGADKTSDELIAGMVGVEPVIEKINTLIHQIEVQKEMAVQGKDIERPTIHMVFSGSPGTGKTTIARIIAKKMKETGILSKGNFYEIKGRDLCGRYIGETTPKTCGYCRAAYGSVLFIDEAYELYRSGEDSKDYGREAITALIAEMENHRDDLCVIMAGYTDEMNAMLESNPGLKSRVRTTIEFPNYSRSELEGIFYNMIGEDFSYDSKFKEKVHEYFEGLSDEIIESKTFANGRFVRNLYENTWGIAALRNEFDDQGRIKLTAMDFTQATEKTDARGTEEFKRRPMGFGAF